MGDIDELIADSLLHDARAEAIRCFGPERRSPLLRSSEEEVLLFPEVFKAVENIAL